MIRCIGVWVALLCVHNPAYAQLDRGEPGVAEDLLALGNDVTATVGAPHLAPIQGTELNPLTDVLSSRLRCPVCQVHAIVDSPAETARNMKRQVRAMVAAGYDEEQIFQYFETSYGEFIRLIPRAE